MAKSAHVKKKAVSKAVSKKQLPKSVDKKPVRMPSRMTKEEKEKATENLRKSFSWISFDDEFALNKAFNINKNVSKLYFPASRDHTLGMHVSFSEPTTMIDAVRAVEKKLWEPLTKEILDDARKFTDNVQYFEVRYKEIKKMGSNEPPRKTLKIGDLLGSPAFAYKAWPCKDESGAWYLDFEH